MDGPPHSSSPPTPDNAGLEMFSFVNLPFEPAAQAGTYLPTSPMPQVDQSIQVSSNVPTHESSNTGYRTSVYQRNIVPADSSTTLLWPGVLQEKSVPQSHQEHAGLPPAAFVQQSHQSVPARLSKNRQITESDDSWNESDNNDTLWLSLVEQQISDLLQEHGQASLVTQELTKRQRHQVHGMATRKNLSHRSLGAGPKKRVLLTKYRLLQPVDGIRAWDTTQTLTRRGTIDPRLVSFDNVNVSIAPNHFQEHLRAMGLLVSFETVLVDASQQVDASSHSDIALYAFFEKPADAAQFYAMLHQTKPNWNKEGRVRCDYPVFVNCDWSPNERPNLVNGQEQSRFPAAAGAEFVSDHSVAREGQLSHDIMWPWHAWPNAPSDLNNPTTDPPPQFSDQALSVPPQPDTLDLSRGTNSSSCLRSEPTSNDSGNKARRLPRIPNGYTCRHQNCSKAFDCAGDRRKHEKYHGSRSERPLKCDKCDQAFWWQKDVRRHKDTHRTKRQGA